ncbi:MAG: hypothetical protein NT154_03475 [Verrucomicrobia bacterium]|nr:hypothetical protein [Verrucomicrobiota bacterium]
MSAPMDVPDGRGIFKLMHGIMPRKSLRMVIDISAEAIDPFDADASDAPLPGELSG